MKNILDINQVIERTRFLWENFKGAKFRKNVDGVTILFICTLPDGDLYLYKLS